MKLVWRAKALRRRIQQFHTFYPRWKRRSDWVWRRFYRAAPSISAFQFLERNTNRLHRLAARYCGRKP